MKKITVNDLSVEEKLLRFARKDFGIRKILEENYPSVCVSDGPVGV